MIGLIFNLVSPRRYMFLMVEGMGTLALLRKCCICVIHVLGLYDNIDPERPQTLQGLLTMSRITNQGRLL